MSEEGNKQSEINQVKIEGELLKRCFSKFPDLEGKTEQAQLMKMQNKYQYFLRKFQKFIEEHQKYKNLYGTIDKMVEESPQIIEENRSIDFINKVMEDTQKKYNKLKEKVDELKSKKVKSHNEMLRLKNILLKMKGEYFELEREEEQILQKKKADDSVLKAADHLKTMFKIRQDKKQHNKQFRIKPIELNRLNMDVSFAERKIVSELDAINQLKQEFLASIGTTMKDYYKHNERELHLQEKANKLITKREFNLKARKKLRKIDGYDPDSDAFEVFRIANQYDRQLQIFMQLSEEEVLQRIVEKGKIDEMMQLIEEEKRGLIEAYRRNKQEKLRV